MIFFIDIDGTITDATRGLDSITDKTRYALKALSENHKVFVSSGRCKTLLPKELREMEGIGFITTNGAYAEYNNKPLFSRFMDKDKVIALRRYCLYHNLSYILEKQDTIFKGGRDDLYDRFISAWSMLAGNVEDDKGLNEDYYMAMIIAESNDLCPKIEEDIKPYLDIRKHYSFSSFDVGEYGIDKGYGVKRVLEILNVPVEESYAFGDEMNDYEMIKESGHGIVMANGNPKLKQIAEEICEDVLEDGLYKYLVKHKIIEAMI